MIDIIVLTYDSLHVKRRICAVEDKTKFDASVGIHHSSETRMLSSRVLFFWRQSEGKITMGWCILEGNPSHLPINAFCCQKKKPCSLVILSLVYMSKDASDSFDVFENTQTCL